MNRLAPLLMMPMLACTAATVPMPLAASGPTEVMLDSVAFIADLQPVSGGAQLTVTRQDTGFLLDEGRLAKSVAQTFCTARAQTLDPQALGAYVGGAWAFDGGCVRGPPSPAASSRPYHGLVMAYQTLALPLVRVKP